MLDPSMMFKASTDIEFRPSRDDITMKEQDSTHVDHQREKPQEALRT